MKKQFVDYLKSLDMGKVLIKRIETFHDRYVCIIGKKPQDLFISEYVNNEGQREYIGAYFFLEDIFYEIEDLKTNTTKTWISKLNGNIAYISFQSINYDFHTPTAKSRLNLDCNWVSDTDFVFGGKASGENCSKLLDVYKKYLHPNMI